MSLSADAIKRLMIALTSKTVGNEVATAINGAASATHFLAGAIVATNVSQTVDFASLKVGDQVAVIHATAGNAHFVTIATAGDLGEAAVVGDLYIVIRAVPAATAGTF